MAKKVTVDLVDDTNPDEKADETVSFGLDNTTYEIDVSSANAAKLREDLGHWIEHARRVSGGRRRSPSTNAFAGGGLPLAEIREWARNEGMDVPSRGRVAAEIIRAWNNRDKQEPAAEPAKAPAKKAAKKAEPKSPVTGDTVLASAQDAAKNDPPFSSK